MCFISEAKNEAPKFKIYKQASGKNRNILMEELYTKNQ